MKREIRVSPELAEQFREICAEVDLWEPWQRSVDPIGSQGLKLAIDYVLEQERGK